MTKPLALFLSLTALTLAGCDSSSDNEDSLSSQRTGSGCTHTKNYWNTYNKYGVGDEYKPWRDEANAYQWFDWDEDSRVTRAVTTPEQIAAELRGARPPPHPEPPGQLLLFSLG